MTKYAYNKTALNRSKLNRIEDKNFIKLRKI